MTTNFEDIPQLAITLHDFASFVYWYFWANLYASQVREWWAFPFHVWCFGGVLNFML